MNIETINGLLEEGGVLEGYEENVTGDDPKKPKTAADIGEDVANAIKKALTGDGGVVVIAINDDINAVSERIQRNDQQGMTWSQIVGSSEIVDKMIMLLTTSFTVSVEAMSVEDVDNSNPTVSTPLTCGGVGQDQCANGQVHSGQYKGISGSYFCEGDKCAVTDSKLTGGWFFTPADPGTLYKKAQTECTVRMVFTPNTVIGLRLKLTA